MTTYFMFSEWDRVGDGSGNGIVWNLVQWLTPKQEAYLRRMRFI
jgi:hypothetical protein